jgi:hypothetical protein
MLGAAPAAEKRVYTKEEPQVRLLHYSRAYVGHKIHRGKSEKTPISILIYIIE